MSQVISDTVEFRHAYQTIPAPTPEDKIIHGLQVISNALKNAPPPTSISQLEAIANLRDLFDSWRLLTPPSLARNRMPTPGRPRVETPLELPRVSTPAPHERTPRTVYPQRALPANPTNFLITNLQSSPPATPDFQATPRRISFKDVSPPRVAIEPRLPSYCPPRSPIAHRTRSRASAPTESLSFAGLCQAFSMTPKAANGFAFLCKALEQVDSASALSVLNPATGEFLEHPQLHQDPRYKATWDTSYANELGRLCQGIGSGSTKTNQ